MNQYETPEVKSDDLDEAITHHLDDRASAHLSRWDGVKITLFLLSVLLGSYIALNPGVVF